jgi:Fe-S-cluster containining protein
VRALHVLQRRATAIRERVQASVSEVTSEGEVAAALVAHRELDAEHARAVARDPSYAPACSAGCSHCCHVHVEATRGEVLAIARHLQKRESIEAFVERLASHVADVGDMDHRARWEARVPCVLLGEDGRCTVYEVRPLRCRAFHSCDAGICRDAFAGASERAPEESAELVRACDAVELGYDRALEDAGFGSQALLLETALLAALRD